MRSEARRDSSRLLVGCFRRAGRRRGCLHQEPGVCRAVALDRSRTPGTGFGEIAINSGNANACTGERGLRDGERMASSRPRAAAPGRAALVLSTGVIGEYLPMEKIAAGLADSPSDWPAPKRHSSTPRRGMMTTDTVHKVAGRKFRSVSGHDHRQWDVQGRGDDCPNMGTMLGLVLTDAPLTPSAGQEILSTVVEQTFNCISVDGHMSTNDTVLLLANGAAGGPPLNPGEIGVFRSAVFDVCTELARAIPADGEGATHLIVIEVAGCATRADARRIAKTVADSPLVKCAIHGADPNWGRIVSAAGYSGVHFDPRKVHLRLNDFELYRDGAPIPFDAREVSASIKRERETHILLEFAEGNEGTMFYTADLTAEYVRLNADYHT